MRVADVSDIQPGRFGEEISRGRTDTGSLFLLVEHSPSEPGVSLAVMVLAGPLREVIRVEGAGLG